MRISDWSSDVCSSDLHPQRVPDHDSGPGRQEQVLLRDGRCLAPGQRAASRPLGARGVRRLPHHPMRHEDTVRLLAVLTLAAVVAFLALDVIASAVRSEAHTSELQSLMRISYAVF